ncbi:MAG: TetR/AcrR family transcriptional regulator [Dehalococcoidia bacterium]|nr:TetR/AcrR family transcriptional regulator [Dehalococcoidia bacterium]
MDVKRRKAEQSETTRRALLRAARELFAARGFAETPTEEIVQQAGVTRGALYHHFEDKQALFKAVFEELEVEFSQKVATAVMAAEGDLWKKLLAATNAFLDACLEPEIQRIVLLDAPSVLGWETYRQMEEKHGAAQARAFLQEAMNAGVIEQRPVEPLAHLLLSSLHEGGLFIVNSDDVRAARAEVGSILERLLEGLKVRDG